ncbi:hypothetical protein XP1511_21885 [Xanthomonas perforans]|uniref:DNA 3'-5' helicase n=3 Tax=Xanthomonas TaxID=338 RepID=A0A6V7FHV0_9XANT|nr:MULTISPECIES: ATP-dependent helicase [Xanthomonas]KLC01947.1 hypothetical protein XP315_20480 [Xanthomonas perforans]KLC11114.1 hypothetical protein XP4B_13265 [Xanthomonas perforans]KLC15496.1 hypothetical protein XP56_16950 [Xanthomonas perforans]KLC36754.1 hypothetical protein XP112_11020 [Xanthomonas perforans]KLC40011.1 hypothetical protein XP95_00835 [Xanthomonas perforans]
MLNPGQQQAVRASGHAMICACPGSGKTTVLKFRASHLLELDPASRLLAVTFTSAAAGELEERIRSQNPKLGDRLVCGTFHSLAKRQLERSGKRVNLKAQAAGAIMRSAYSEVVTQTNIYPFDEIASKVEYFKTHIDHSFGSPQNQMAEEVYLRYRELMAERGFHDFSDLLLLATRGMAKGAGHPDFVVPYKVDYMLADEFQDTDDIQFKWIAEHIKHGAKVTVVGDDDQSIFGFRFAGGYKCMTEFQQLTDAQVVNLDTTYRCAAEILAPASKLIAYNAERLHKNLVTENKAHGQVRVLRFPDRGAENTALTAAILDNGDYGNWAVLARTNSQLEKVEQILQESGIPSTRSGRTPFWELEVPALFLSVLKSLAAGDMAGFDQLLRRGGVDESDLTRITSRVMASRPGALQRFLNEPDESDSPMVKRLASVVPTWVDMAKDPSRVDRVFLGLNMFMSRNMYGAQASRATIERNNRLLASCEGSIARLSGTLKQRLQHIQRQAEGTDEDSDAVRLMTLHASKGLEFKHVWIIGCEQGVIPSNQSPVEEERRLFYVGMTRAKLNLFLSYQRNSDAQPSEFLAEAGLI